MNKYRIIWVCQHCMSAPIIDEGDSADSIAGSQTIIRMWAKASCPGCRIPDVRLYPMVNLQFPSGGLEWGRELLQAVLWDAFEKGYRVTMEHGVAGEVGKAVDQ